ncbi:MAG: histidine-type phosphatase [Lachnospiraceae bacterium]|nr:histidine-type phosphatase [Lachnospiraceae bacterium]
MKELKVLYGKIIRKVLFSIVFSTTILLFSSCKNDITISSTNNKSVVMDAQHLSGQQKGYKLKQVVVLSRHNVRSPLGNSGSEIDNLTPHKWFDWTSKQSQLSIRGGVLETEMGQYFRKWFEREKLFSENYDPKNIDVLTDEVRIYANSKQRTLATANYFLTGLFPVSDLDVEHHMEYDTMDPVFNPVLTNIDDEFIKVALEQMKEMSLAKVSKLKPNYDLIESVVDVKESNDYKEGKFIGFKTDDDQFILENNKEPVVKGSLKKACLLSDALTAQYYECSDDVAAFGKKISYEDWEKISEVKDVYEDVLFTASIVATNVAKPLLTEMLKEINNENRKFTFLCGHDSNVDSVLAALNVNEYFLPLAIERKTPIGCKIVVSTWTKDDDKTNSEYMSIDMMYQSVDQLRGIEMLDEKNPPAIYKLSFKELNRNADGYFRKDDVVKLFEEAIAK